MDPELLISREGGFCEGEGVIMPPGNCRPGAGVVVEQAPSAVVFVD